MKPRYYKTLCATVFGLIGATLLGQAVELIPSAGMTAIAGDSFDAVRAPERAINGFTDGSIFLAGGLDPNNPADYRNDASQGNPTSFGQRVNWSGTGGGNNWLRVDLGADYVINSMAFFNLTVSTGGNTIRGVQQGDIYYRTEADGDGNNVDDDQGPFDPTGWTILGTAGSQTFTQGLAADVPGGTSQSPDVIPFGAVTARYVAIDVNSAFSGNTVGIGELLFFRDTNEDPVLEVDPASADASFVFGNVFADTTRSVTYVNNSLSGTATINVDDISILDDGGGAFTSLNVIYDGGNSGTPPLLENGDKVTIEITTGNSLPGPLTGSLSIDTTSGGAGLNVDPDFNDITPVLGVEVTYASGAIMNQGGLLETDLSGWPGNGGAVHVTPGIAAGSEGMARVPGQGDANGDGDPSSLYQTAVPDGASDFEFVAYFTPVSTANFVSYVDPDGTIGITGPDGDFTDRTFQWVLLGSDADTPAPAYGDDQAAQTIINLAYMPDGVTNGGTPDFYVFDGTTWNPLGIGAIAGSVDNDADADPTNGVGDGLLDTTIDPLDVINSYKLRLVGTGFGTGSASYDVSVTKVSGPDSFTTGSATNLTVFHGLDGATNTPASHAFITSDLSSGSNIGDGTDPGFRTPFWVDDVVLANGTIPDPTLTVLGFPSRLLVDPAATSGTISFTVRNDGATASLNVASIDITASGFSITSASSFMLAASEIQQIDVEWDSTASLATPLYETATLTINGPDIATIEVPLEAAILINQTAVIGNGDFETPGTDNVTDTDTFAVWDEGTNPAVVTDVAGLIASSTTAANFSPGGAGTIRTNLTPNFTTEPLINFTLDFFVQMPGTDRDVNYRLFAPGGGGANLGYFFSSGEFMAYDQKTLKFVPVLAVALAPDTPYRVKTIGTGWGTANPTLSLEVFDAAGASLGTSEPFAYFQTSVPTVGGLANFFFSNTSGNNGGCTLDEVSLDGQNIDTSPPAAPSITSAGFNGTGGFEIVVKNLVTGRTYNLQRDPDLNSGFTTTVDSVVAGSDTETLTDENPPLPGKAFYRVED